MRCQMRRRQLRFSASLAGDGLHPMPDICPEWRILSSTLLSSSLWTRPPLLSRKRWPARVASDVSGASSSLLVMQSTACKLNESSPRVVPLSEYIFDILVLLVLRSSFFGGSRLFEIYIRTPLVNYVNQARFLYVSLCLIVVALIEPLHMTANCQQVAP